MLPDQMTRLDLFVNREPSPESQCGRLLAHLRAGNSITPYDAYQIAGILACHSRISELRKLGYQIRCELVKTQSGKVVGKYSLA